jgi:hypothetical protein
MDLRLVLRIPNFKNPLAHGANDDDARENHGKR